MGTATSVLLWGCDGAQNSGQGRAARGKGSCGLNKNSAASAFGMLSKPFLARSQVVTLPAVISTFNTTPSASGKADRSSAMEGRLAIQPRQQTTVASSSTTAPSATGSSLTASATGSLSGTASTTATSSKVTIPADAAPGEIVFTQPPLQSTSYYKIASGEYITFGWNFTDLYVTPTSLTLSAVCDNGNTYPIGPTDGVIPGNAQSVVWYPYGYQTGNPTVPLAQASYTLHIWGDGGPSAAATPGYLDANSDLEFALYTPQPYTPLASGKFHINIPTLLIMCPPGWMCVGCGGALAGVVAHPASVALVTTLLIVFLSGFTTLRRVWD